MLDFDRRRTQRGFTLIELLIVIAIILIIAAIAIPKLNVERMNAQEMAAIRQIGTINTAQIQYYSQFGKYASTLAELGPPKSGAAGQQAADLIPETLSSGKNDGYVFTVQPTPTGYSVNANPEQFGGSGRRTFYCDQTQVIRQNWGQEPATVNSPPFKQ
jgi:type IV pilus assembly protein PilA